MEQQGWPTWRPHQRLHGGYFLPLGTTILVGVLQKAAKKLALYLVCQVALKWSEAQVCAFEQSSVPSAPLQLL
jgi:hypothetical protein